MKSTQQFNHGQLSEMDNKQIQEEEFIEGYKQVYDNFPVGKVCQKDPPAPDFIVYNPERIIGIEVTQYIRGQDKNGSDRQIDKAKQRIEDTAKSIFEEKHNIPLIVSIRFPSRINLKEISRGEERKFIQDIVKDIESNIPDQLNENKNIISANYSIGITRVKNQSCWRNQGGWLQGFPHEIQARINDKHQKIAGYRKYCESLGEYALWLLIVAAGDYISSQLSFNNLDSIAFNTYFDKVFFYDRFNNFVIPLRIRKIKNKRGSLGCRRRFSWGGW